MSVAKDMVMIAMFTAIVCILAPITIPIGPIPLSMTTFLFMIWGYIAGWRKGLVIYILYMVMGFIGLPVFAGFNTGIGTLFGPTGGYLFGYLFLVIFSGIAGDRYSKDKKKILLLLVIATILMYGCGTAWFCYFQQINWKTACGVCVLPFLPGDIIKTGMTLIWGTKLKNRLKAGWK